MHGRSRRNAVRPAAAARSATLAPGDSGPRLPVAWTCTRGTRSRGPGTGRATRSGAAEALRCRWIHAPGLAGTAGETGEAMRRTRSSRIRLTTGGVRAVPLLSARHPAVRSTRPRTRPQGAHGSTRADNENGICPGAARQARDEPGRGPNASDRLRSWSCLGWNCQNGVRGVENPQFSVPESR